MRYTVCLFILIFAGCSSPSSPGGRHESGPLLATSNGRYEHTFVVKNTTGRAVRIVDKIPTCTCTVAELDRTELGPGQDAKLTMKINLPAGAFNLDVRCDLMTDNPEFARWVYNVHVEQYPRIDIDQPHLDLGRLGPASGKVEAAGRLGVLVYASANSPAPAIERIDGAPELDMRVVGEPKIERLGGLQRLRAEVAIGLKPGAHSGYGETARSITVFSRAGDAASLTVRWGVEAPIAASPPYLHLGVVDGETPPKTAQVELKGPSAFRLLPSAEMTDGTAVRLRPSSGASEPASVHHVALEFTLPPRVASTSLSGVVRIGTDLADQPEVRIPWSVFVRAPIGPGMARSSLPTPTHNER